VSEESPRTRPSQPDSEDVEIPADDPVDPKAARRARRAKAKLALRIPDDEVVRPQAKSSPSNGDVEEGARPTLPSSPPIQEARHDSIKPTRIISVGPPPPDPAEVATKKESVPPPAQAKEIAEDQKTVKRIPSSPPTAPIEEADRISSRPPPAPPTVIDSVEAAGDDIDVPVDEEEPEYRPRMPTIPSNPPPPPSAEARSKSIPPPPPAPEKPKQPSDDALEIDDVEAAAVLSSRPPPRANVVPPAVPAPPRVPSMPAITKPVSTPASPPPAAPAPPVTPLIPTDAMSSTPHLTEEPKTRPRAQALIDDEEAGAGLEEIEPDRASSPPSDRSALDSGDEIDTSDLVVAVPPAPAARPVSTPPKPAPAAKPPPPKDAKEAPKTGGMIPIVAPSLSTSTPAAGVPSPLAPPPLTEALVPRRRARPWWEELFNDDFIRTMPKFTEAQIAAEVDFIEDSLGVARGGSLLDLGCGTGRQAVELSRRGYSVVGFDLSISMLARAGEEAQEQNQKINFVQGDMREMTFEDAFDGIYCWGSSFGYFEEEKNVHVINRIHKALRQGGQFLLDVVSRDFVIKQAPSLAWFEGEGCVCMDEMTVDWITSRMRIKRTMMLDDGRSKEIEYSIRIYSLHELGKILHDCGFRVAEVSGRIQTPGVFFGPESPRTLILAEKR
jgi:SAM-dependent methyltransferase